MSVMNKSNLLLATAMALAALCDFLYYLPFLGNVLHAASLFSHILPVGVMLLMITSLAERNRGKKRELFIVAWLLMVFIFIFGMRPTSFFLYSGLIAIVLMDERQRQMTFEKFLTIFCWIILINALAYPFIMFGVMPSLGVLDPDNWLKMDVGMYYENFGISYVLHGLGNSFEIGNLLLYRMSAWFEEPGNVGTIAALLLGATRFRMDWKGKILLLGGVLSFSLAFFALVMLYLLMTKPKSFIYIVPLVLLAGWYFQDNEFISSKLLDRVSISDSGISGDNRTEVAFDNAFTQYANTPSVWLGHDAAHQLYKLSYNTSSWKNLVWDYGIVGTIMYLSVFFIIFFVNTLGSKQGNFSRFKQLLPFLIIFMLSIYQRPYVLGLSFFLIFVGAMVFEKNGRSEYA